ncbi:helix-turn-helix domain-containing protein [Streptomyces sasae]|uniref:helix-turn-helix domain-containing protein n=1 Tax=Streptomyces sasae TaxID=1266772 RepID=UPI00292D1376|nr:helix-turn-helix transcriptional regulator [Streptomyces sasae]
MTPQEEFAEALRVRREAAKLSLAELAERVHYSKSYLSRVENGLRPPGRLLAERCDAALRADGALLALLPAGPEKHERQEGHEGRGGREGPDEAGRSGRAVPRRPHPDLIPSPSARPSGYGTEFDQHIRRGDTRHLLGEMYEAGQHYQAAYETAGEDELARSYAVVRSARRWSDPGQVDRDLLFRIDACLAALADREDPPAVELRLRLTVHRAKKIAMAIGDDTAVTGAEPRTGARLARQALAELRERGRRSPGQIGDEARCEVLTESRWALYDFAPARELLALSTELRDLAVRSHSAYFQGEALVALAIDQLRTGRVPTAEATVSLHREFAARHRSRLAHWQQGTLDALMSLWRGEFAAAEGWILGEAGRVAGAMESGLSMPADTLSQTVLGQEYWLRHEQGRLAELFASPRMAGVQRRGYFPVWRAGLALALCETGRYEQAVDQVRAFAADADGFTRFPPSGWALPTAAILAQVCAGLAERTDRRAEISAYLPPLRALLDPHGDELVLAGWPTVLLGPAARFSGLLALAAGEPDTALAHLARAVRLVQRYPAQMARLRLDEARVRLRTGSPAARDLARTALGIAEELGMAALARDCRELLRSPAGR